MSDGTKALELILEQATWTHRRVETLTFQANGETQRRLSWDFTLPDALAIRLPGQRVALPLATLRKEPLKRLDVRDAGGRAIPVWGAVDNGGLAVEVLSAGLGGVLGNPLDPDVIQAIEAVVFADGASSVRQELALIADRMRSLPSQPSSDVQIAMNSLVATLAESFLLIIEVPDEVIGVRTVLKANYEDERAKQSPQVNLTGQTVVDIEANGWGYAKSWHLEVRAPDGLRVADLSHETWDPQTDEVTSHDSDGGGVSTAHITVSRVSPYDESSCHVRFVPERSALLNPLTMAAVLCTALLWLSRAMAGAISDRLTEPGASAASLGAVVFGLPAVFFTMLTRSGEHELVSKVLLGPRLASLGCAICLWSVGVTVVWQPGRDELAGCLTGAALVHSACLAWLVAMRYVGGRT